MRVISVLVVFVILAGCSPVSPTGNVVSSAITDQGEVLISYAVFSDTYRTPVRINVYGDLVDTKVYIDADEQVFTGTASSRDGWVRDKATAVRILEPGTHRVVAVSCTENLFSYDCKRISRSIRI